MLEHMLPACPPSTMPPSCSGLALLPAPPGVPHCAAALLPI